MDDYQCAYCAEPCPSSEHCISKRFEEYFCTPECHRAWLRSTSSCQDAALEDAELETLYGRPVIAAPPPKALARNNVRGKGLTRAQWLPATRAPLTAQQARVATAFDAAAANANRHKSSVNPLKKKLLP
jgi:hypothetical protein